MRGSRRRITQASTLALRARSFAGVEMAAVLLAVLLSIALPLGGGGWRDDHLAAATATLAVVLALVAKANGSERDRLEAKLRDRRFLAVLGAVSLALVLTAAQALSSPIADAARQRGVLDLALAATFLGTSLIAASGRRAATLFVNGIVVGALVIAVLSVLHGETESLAWPFTSHAQLGALFAGAAAFAFVIPASSWTAPNIHRALLGIGACVFLAVVTAASQSRSAFLALGTGLFVAVALQAPRGTPPFRTRLAAGVVAVLLAGALLWTRTTGRWNLLVDSAHGPLHERAGVFRATLSLIGDAPLLGSGLAAYGSRIWRHTPPGFGGAIEHAHCLPLEVIAERGLLGALVLLAVLVLVAREAVRASAPARGTATAERTLARRAALAAGVLLLQSLVDVSLNTPSLALLAAAAAGVAVGLAPADAAVASSSSRSTRLLALSGTAVACLILTAGLWGWLTAPRTQATLALQNGDRASALVVSRESLARFSADRLSLRRLAWSGAGGEFVTLAALDPFDPFVELGAASFHESQGDLPQAEASLRHSIALHPGGWEVRRAWIAFLARHDRLGEAIVESTALAELYPERVTDLAFWAADVLENPLLAESLAPLASEPRRRIAQHLLGQDRGVDSALRLLTTLPREPGNTLHLARALARKGRTDESRPLARELSRERGATGLAGATLFAELAVTAEEVAEAIDALQSSLARSSPVDPGGAQALLNAYARAGRARDADTWLDAALQRDPASSALRELRLSRRWQAGDAAGAMADARRLIELSPHVPNGRLALARIYEARGSLAGARQLYSEALAVSPGNPEATAALARLPASSTQ